MSSQATVDALSSMGARADRTLRMFVSHLRMDHKLSLREVAERTGMSVADIKKMENRQPNGR